MAKANLSKAPCRQCLRQTKHFVLKVRLTEGETEVESYGPVSWQDQYEMLECCGCETVSLRHTHSFSEEADVQVVYYPPPVSRAMPRWTNSLPVKLSLLLGEVYKALHADSRRLALMGARAVLDLVLLEKVGDSGTFQAKLELLEKQGHVGRRNREFLAVALDAGHAATHRGF